MALNADSHLPIGLCRCPDVSGRLSVEFVSSRRWRKMVTKRHEDDEKVRVDIFRLVGEKLEIDQYM